MTTFFVISVRPPIIAFVLGVRSVMMMALLPFEVSLADAAEGERW